MIFNTEGIEDRIAGMTALQMLETLGYKPDIAKTKRAAEYLEMWRKTSTESTAHTYQRELKYYKDLSERLLRKDQLSTDPKIVIEANPKSQIFIDKVGE